MARRAALMYGLLLLLQYMCCYCATSREQTAAERAGRATRAPVWGMCRRNMPGMLAALFALCSVADLRH